jgi:hypothetical protein
MEDLVAALESVDAALDEIVRGMFADAVLSGEPDERLLAAIGVAARISRRAEAVLMDGAAEVEYRATVPPGEERISNRYGCRNASELVQRVTRVSSRSAASLLTAGRAIVRDVAPSSGETLPAEYPAVRAEVAAGRVGVDGVLAVVGPLAGITLAAGTGARLAADEELAAVIRGEGVDAGPPPCADDLRALATVWAAYLDQDGAEPRETAAIRKRGITLGVCRDGLVPLRGNLLPEVAGQLQLVFDSILNPKADDAESVAPGPRFGESLPSAEHASSGEAPSDDVAEHRTRTQRQHDAFATAMFKVAGSGALPALGGTAPTLVVSVRAEDLRGGRGYAHIDGIDEPVSLTFARQIACAGAVQRVLSDERDRIVAIETSDRVFTHHQRKALALRDGGCLIPGCRVAASWCEIHHVTEHAKGGATHTDNGVLLCWWHHRTLDQGMWGIRMNRGIPEVRGPKWWDPSARWRPTTTSPTRMRERLHRRT